MITQHMQRDSGGMVVQACEKFVRKARDFGPTMLNDMITNFLKALVK